MEARAAKPDPSLLRRVRGLFLTLASALALITEGPVLGAHPVALGTRLGVATASLLLVTWWFAGWRRGRFPLPVEPVEWLAVSGPLVLLGAGNGGVGLYFGAIFFRGLYGGWRAAVLRTVLAELVILIPMLAHFTYADGQPVADPGLLGAAAFMPAFMYLLQRMMAQHDRLVRRERVLRAGSAAVAATRDREELQRVAVETALALAGDPDGTSVTLGVRDRDAALVVSAAGVASDQLVGQSFELSQLSAELVQLLASGEPVVIRDGGRSQVGLLAEFGARAAGVLILPMRAGDKDMGALTISSEQPLPVEIQASLATWATQVASCLESVALHEELQRRAFHDPLTELPNRALVDQRLATAIAACPPGRHAAFLLIDLDHFKPVNDQYGHQAGDELLRQIAERLLECVRGDDTVGRLGGDEFAVVLPALAARDEALDVARRLVSALEAPFALSPHVVSIGASVGVAFVAANPEVTDADLVAVVRAADAAMYQAKSTRSGGWVVYDPSLHAAA